MLGALPYPDYVLSLVKELHGDINEVARSARLTKSVLDVGPGQHVKRLAEVPGDLQSSKAFRFS